MLIRLYKEMLTHVPARVSLTAILNYSIGFPSNRMGLPAVVDGVRDLSHVQPQMNNQMRDSEFANATSTFEAISLTFHPPPLAS